MATATKNPSRKRKAKATADQVTADQVAADVEEIDEVDAEAKAAADKAEAARQEELHDLGAQIGDTLEDIKTADSASAIEAREKWVDVGRLLIAGEALFIGEDSNTVNDKKYGQWLKEEGFTALGARPTRAAAKWMATVNDTNPGLWSLFPTESLTGQPLRRSPQTLYSWVRERTYSSFQYALENTGDEDGVDLVLPANGDAASKEAAAKHSIPNVIDEAKDRADELEKVAITEQEKYVKAADPKARTKPSLLKQAMAEQVSARAQADEAQLDLDILMNLTDEERAKFFIGWKPSVKAVKFGERGVDDAAQFLFDTYVKGYENPGPMELVEALAGIVQSHLDKVDTDGGDIDDDASDDEPEELDEDFDDDDFDDDDFLVGDDDE